MIMQTKASLACIFKLIPNKSLHRLAFFSSASSPSIIFNKPLASNVTVVTLNRPKSLNAINTEIASSLTRLYEGWESNPDRMSGALIMKGAGGKAFCSGGELKDFDFPTPDTNTTSTNSGAHSDSVVRMAAINLSRKVFNLIYKLQSSPVPQVSMWDGIVMGGGVGISIFGKYKIATENTYFAMPEAAIGLFPDVGSSVWMPRLKSGFGNYIGLTGGHLRGHDLVYAGIATHYIPKASLQYVEHAIVRGCPKDPYAAVDVVRDILDSFAVKQDEEFLSKSILRTNEDFIRKVFLGPSSVEEVMEGLRRESDAGNAFSRQINEKMAKLSPLSLKLIFESLRRGKDLDIPSCLEMECLGIARCLEGPNAKEGIRAALIDRDRQPKWEPSTIEAVTDENIQKYFKPRDPSEYRWIYSP